MKRRKYHNYEFNSVAGNEYEELENFKIEVDQINWRVLYHKNSENLIGFYPFGEYHGGGQLYVINILSEEFGDWCEWEITMYIFSQLRMYTF